MWIALQRLLNLQGKTIHPTTHVGRTRCQPDANTRRRNNHRRSTVITRRSVTRPTSCPTLTDVPSGSVISILPPDIAGSSPLTVDASTCFMSLPFAGSLRLHRQDAAQLLVAVVVIALHRRLLDGTVDPRDLTIGPR